VLLAIVGQCFTLVAVTCFVLMLRHAFQRSLGTGFMVLCIPLFAVYYGFAQFEHRQKGLIVAGTWGGLIVGVILRTLGTLHYGAA
jgi:benzodiazapine receptor